MSHYITLVNSLNKFNLFYNINSSDKNFDELQVYLELFDNTFDIVVLCKNLNLQDVNHFDMRKYDIFYNN